MAKEYYAHIYLDERTEKLLEEATRKTELSRSRFIREALREKFARMGLLEEKH
mgnify:CR=1 FL=1